MDEIAKLGLSENEYQELLQQAVAVINDTRQRVAKQVNGNVTSAYWKIGKLLYERKIESTHGSGVVKRLSVDLKAQYCRFESSIPKHGAFHTTNVEHEEVLSTIC